MFSKGASHWFPPSRPWNHTIEFKQGTPDAIPCKVYLMTQAEDKVLEEFIKEQYAKGYICPSKSPYMPPFFFIKKRDRKLRPVQDYQHINNYTIKNQYPLLLISKLTESFSHVHLFTKLDVCLGYKNVHIKGDEHKAAFKTKDGLWEPMVILWSL